VHLFQLVYEVLGRVLQVVNDHPREDLRALVLLLQVTYSLFEMTDNVAEVRFVKLFVADVVIQITSSSSHIY